MKHNARVNLKINEPEGSTKGLGMGMGGNSQSPAMKTVDEAMADLKI